MPNGLREDFSVRAIFHYTRTSLIWLLVVGCFLENRNWAAAQGRTDQEFSRPSSSIWKNGVGEGFKAGAMEVGLSLGGGIGMRVLGSERRHDWVIGTVQYGIMLCDVVGQDHWYRGNWELLGEVFGAGQFNPDSGYAVGFAPHFRYNFATGHRWVPFFDIGAGVTSTDIGNGDISTTFEFNLQAGPGVHVFLRDNMALTLQYRFMHLSNANLKAPNLGVNTSNFLIGLSWFF